MSRDYLTVGGKYFWEFSGLKGSSLSILTTLPNIQQDVKERSLLETLEEES